MPVRSILLLAALSVATSAASGAQTEAPAQEIRRLLDGLDADTLACEKWITLIAVAQMRPEWIEAAGRSPRGVLAHVDSDRRCNDQPDDRQTIYALAIHAYRDGDGPRGDRLFARAVASAASDRQRADLYYSRGASRHGSPADYARAVGYDPGHAPSLYRLAGLAADSVGRQSTPAGRMAYWCAADRYWEVAARSTDENVLAAATRAARAYERAGPTAEEVRALGLTPGETVRVEASPGGSCRAVVRARSADDG